MLVKHLRLYLLVTLLALLAAGHNTAQAYEDIFSFNWIQTGDKTSRFMITCNNIPVFDVQVNRPSTQSKFSYTFDGNKSLTGNNRPYDVRLNGTLIYNV